MIIFFDRLIGRVMFSALMLSLALVLTATPGQAADLTAAEKANEALVRDFFAAFEDRDMEKTKSFMSDDFTYQNGMNGKRNHGKQHFADWWWSMVNDATLLKPTILRLTVMGNTVLLENTMRYKDATNDITFRGTKFFYVKDGKIKEYQEYRLPK